MSELINAKNGQFRRHLLTNVSVFALSGVMCAASGVNASESERPTVWIELGGQLERVDSQQATFAPAFFDLASPANVQTLTDAQRPSRYAIGGEGKITIAPEGSSWTFSATIRYGRSNASRHLQHQTTLPPMEIYLLPFIPTTIRDPARKMFADAQPDLRESHAVLDFMAGKDVGLGLFGAQGSAVVSAGVRFAQFLSKADTPLHARPVYDVNLTTVIPGKYKWYRPLWQTYTAVLHSDRSTRGIGPSLSWDASLPIEGNGSDATFAFDWGVNAAVLFGRQRTTLHHQTTSYYFHRLYGTNVVIHQSTRSGGRNETRSVVIPNIGGFAGFSLNFPNAKVQLGYRADFFFNAVDNGIDTRHVVNEGFYGPFATISVGLGG